MSAHPSGTGGGESADQIDTLLAQLRAGSEQRINLESSSSYGYYNSGNPFQPAQQHIHGYQQSSSPLPAAGPTSFAYKQQPHSTSVIMSPTENLQHQLPHVPPPTMGGAQNAGRTTLLNLLKFKAPTPHPPKQPDAIGTPLPPSREPSISFSAVESLPHVATPLQHTRQDSDLLAALMGSIQAKPSQESNTQFATSYQPQSNPVTVSPSADTQAYLLQLLNQPKPSHTDSTPHLKPTKVLTPPSKASSQGDVSELTQALEEASLDLNLMGAAATEKVLFVQDNTCDETPKTQGLFTYVNPFDQLAASSPRIRTPKSSVPGSTSLPSASIQILRRQGDIGDNKRKIDERSNISSPAQSHSKRKLGAVSQASSGPPTPLPDGRTHIDALLGIGASDKKETVANALSEVGNKVDKQVQDAIARAEHDENQVVLEKGIHNMLQSKTGAEVEETTQVAAKSIKKELDKVESRHTLDDLPTPSADFAKDVVDDTGRGHIADSWESADAEDSPVKEADEKAVKVYNFPMKPWTSIVIKAPDGSRPIFRDEVVMDVARLKKEFDQIDRTLVTASNNFIVYGMSKYGGIRIISQDDGRDARLFTETHDRIFSVVISKSQPDSKEAIIGTGVSGTVYWALVKDGSGNHLEESNPEMHAFAFPPIQAADNETPGGILKTRARKSSCHPEFFAVGRGKTIHIIWPIVILDSYIKNGKDRMVDTDKYLAQYSLKVNTGKAGKDFTFSEDDSTIISLDKAGRVKFWDVRHLTNADHSHSAAESTQIEIKDPIVTFATTSAYEKAWPTSVMLVDKLRPYQRGGALRYLIVGMKQNHSLQLWDLALGKPVQEIHLPHSKESDAVCSVLYHAATGMIVVGHPTRNSIYFLHLSAPKYNLPRSTTQAEYMQKLVTNDPSISKPESTAVISGMREYSLENKGSLRSLDILQTPSSAAVVPGEPIPLFELYAMHSRGVTCITIKQAELGWTLDNKVIHPVSAEKDAIISIDTLKEIPVVPTPEVVEVNPPPSVSTRIVPRPSSKEAAPKEPSKKASHAHPESAPGNSVSITQDRMEKKDSAINGATNSGTEKHGKNKRRKGTSSNEQTSSSFAPSQHTSPGTNSSSNLRNGATSKSSIAIPEPAAAVSASQSPGLAPPGDSEARTSEDIKKLLTDSLDSLHQEIKNDRRAQSLVASTNQEHLLRLVAKTLADNIDATLDKVISSNIEKSVIPLISDVTAKAVNQQIGEQLSPKLASQLNNSIPKELQRALPDVIGRALQQPQLLKLMAESLAKSVAFKVEDQFAATMQKVVIPAFENLAVQTLRKVAENAQRQANEQISSFERQRHADSAKIDQLMQLVTGLTETVSSMAAAQTEFQGQFIRAQKQVAMEKRGTTRNSQTETVASAVITGSAEETERARLYQTQYTGVTKHMNDENFVAGVITWLQSGFIQELFEAYFCKYNPEFIRDMNSVILLSIGSAVSEKLEDLHMRSRLSYLDMVVTSLQAQVNADHEDDARAHIPKIVGTWIQRLEHLFLQITTINAQDPHLKQVQNLVTGSKRIVDSLVASASSPLRYAPSTLASNQGRRY